jgi:hypothetical protein
MKATNQFNIQTNNVLDQDGNTPRGTPTGTPPNERRRNSEENSILNTDDFPSILLKSSSSKYVKWSPENELIMVEWCDIAQCYKWLHTKCHKNLSILHAWFTIPAIALSTISGTASFATARITDCNCQSDPTSFRNDIQFYIPMVIGSINILIGISTTVQQYLKISELNESHRISAISWDKFARNIRIELAKDPEERMEASHFIKICRSEFDRLMETSPIIKDSVIKDFQKSFNGAETKEEQKLSQELQHKRFNELRKPDIFNIIISANESRHQWYKDPKRLQTFNQKNEERDLENQIFENSIKNNYTRSPRYSTKTFTSKPSFFEYPTNFSNLFNQSKQNEKIQPVSKNEPNNNIFNQINPILTPKKTFYKIPSNKQNIQPDKAQNNTDTFIPIAIPELEGEQEPNVLSNSVLKNPIEIPEGEQEPNILSNIVLEIPIAIPEGEQEEIVLSNIVLEIPEGEQEEIVLSNSVLKNPIEIPELEGEQEPNVLSNIVLKIPEIPEEQEPNVLSNIVLEIPEIPEEQEEIVFSKSILEIPIEIPEGEQEPNVLSNIVLEIPIEIPEGEQEPNVLSNIVLEIPIEIPEGEQEPNVPPPIEKENHKKID